MEQTNGLDDPAYAAFAWGRYRRILGWMAGAAGITATVAVALLWLSLGEMYLSMALGTFFGVFFTVLLTAALMGLMFLSSGSGHDAQVEDRLKGEIDLD